MSIRIMDCRQEVGDVVCEVAEGPIWDDRFGLLRWVDLNRGLVHGYSPARGQLPAMDLGQHAGFVVPSGSEHLLAGVRDGFGLVGPDGSLTMMRAVEADRPGMRMNDGKADPAGRVWAGTMGIDNPGPDGTLYSLGPDWSVTPRLTGLTIPNGIGWSPGGERMYFTDTTWGRIDVFSYDGATGEIADRRVFAQIPADAGAPDGLTVDEDGCVWIALWYGAAVHRYTPTGSLDTVVRIPALQATSCVFGGSDRQDLFVTSARQRLTGQQQSDHPRSGRVFACRPGVAGLPTSAFRAAA